MNCFIATEGLPAGPGHFPAKMPTHRLHIPHLGAIAAACGCMRASTGFFVSAEALRAIENDPEYQACDGLFWVHVAGSFPRFDLVDGNWVKREPGTPEYEAAMCEDAIIMDRANEVNKHSLRFRRVVAVGELEFSES